MRAYARSDGVQEVSDAVAGVEGRAFGTHLRVVVSGGDQAQLDAATRAVDEVVADIDAACSRFRDDSELVRVNGAAGSEQVVSPLLGVAIATALRGARLTDGAVDPTVGSAMRRAGYDVDFDDIPADGGALVVHAFPVPGWQTVRYSPERHVLFAPLGVELDLGATAKALAADLAVAAAFAAVDGAAGVLVSLGGDISTAGAAPDGGWVIQLSEDSSAGVDPHAERVVIRDGGLATSSTRVRRWVRGGVEQHHIIDPATGAPAITPWHLVTVVAATCVDANIASTCAVVRGTEAPDWLEAKGLPARLVAADGAITRVAGWPPPIALS